MSTKQSRNFNIVTYLDPETLNTKLADHWEKINWYAWIIHDSDYIDPYHKESGYKKTHTHLVLVSRSPITIKTVKNWLFDPITNQNSFVEFTCNVNGACRYLMHLDDPQKTQYDRNLIHTTREDFDNFINSNDDGCDIYREAVFDLLNGWDDLSLVEKYGNIYIRYRYYIELTAKNIKREYKARQDYEQNYWRYLENDYWKNCIGYITEGRE